MQSGLVSTRQLLSTALLFGLSGCPHQELAPLVPCTVSVVSVDATQSGTDQVDLLFVIDNSGSMSEEQVKLNAQLPRLVQALTSGDFDGMPNPDGQRDFRPVGSLRLAVVSTDLGANGMTGIRSCGSNSYAPTEQNMGAMGVDNVDRPFGDDGLLLNSTAVATAGVSTAGALGVGAPMVAVAPRPECAIQVPRVLEYPSGGSAMEIAQRFSCVAELGVNGCAIEQQLESMWKSLAPSTDRSFSRATGGHGTPPGLNAGFLRPEAILAVIVVTDEEDCSAPDANAMMLYSSADLLQINQQCGRQAALLHPVARYLNGLKSLKTEAFQDRVIFAGIVGVPLASATRGQSLQQILMRPEMQFAVQGGALGTVRPVCTAAGGAGSATPARRIVEVAAGFGENGVITSICEADYRAALDAVIAKIAGKLSGECLPRRLIRNSDGLVACRVVELKTAGDRTPCDPARGRTAQLRDRIVNDVPRVTCEIAQLAVRNSAVPQGVGWYYDDFSTEVNRCTINRQRIAFTPAAGIDNGASARFECFRSVAAEPSDPAARGIEAINTSCADTGAAAAPGRPPASGNARCAQVSLEKERLVCVNGSCQLRCMRRSDCPEPMACTAEDGGEGICVNPTCPGE